MRRPRAYLHLIILVCGLLFFGAIRTTFAAPEPQVSYTKDIAPLFAKYCVRCHGGERPRAQFALDKIQSEEQAEQSRAQWDKVIRVIQSREMPPQNRPQPTAQERALMLQYLSQQLAAVNCDKVKNPGRVTIRRLNRAEYNNTVRDLMGVDFTPADDFPSDDVGYGFDNIGDVLSMPPVLMEKYLNASERIVSLALAMKGGKVVQSIPAKKMRTEGNVGDADDGYRLLVVDGKFIARCAIPSTSDYVLGMRAYGHQAGDEPVKVELWLNRKKLTTIEVKAEENAPQTYLFKTRIERGLHQLEMRFINDYYNPQVRDPRRRDRNLLLKQLEIRASSRPELAKAYDRIMIAKPGKDVTKEQAARKILSAFMRRAFRRPLKEGEVDRYLKLVKFAETQGDSFETGIKLAVQAVLVSPHFLFKVESDPTGSEDVRTINEHELATRLSYFLWSTMPDEELFKLADKGELRKNLESQVRRMLKDEKSQQLVENFGGQWLQFRNLNEVMPDPTAFPKFSPQLREDMKREAVLFLTSIVQEDRSILEMIDADYTFLNRRLAAFYGMGRVVKGQGFERVSLPKDSLRGGVVTMASVLTVTSNPTRTSPVKRGKWILDNLFNAPPPPPPPEAGELKEEKINEKLPLRDRLIQHRRDPSCAVCHKRMDPLGFALENFDGIGAYRRTEGEHKIDAKATLPSGETFDGPAELKKILVKRKDQFARCVTEKMLTYGLGRGLEFYDRCAVEDVLKRMQKENYKFSAMVLGIVNSEPFQKRKGKAK